ncbi:MAG: hypothetical protein Fur0021_16550 [Candidatus Promineifilaceae bacterium]
MVNTQPHDDALEKPPAARPSPSGIVRGIWLDQARFWRRIRPQLEDRRQGRKLLLQALLHTICLSLFLSALAGGALSIILERVNWPAFLQGGMAGWGAAILLALLSLLLSGLAAGVVRVTLFTPLLTLAGILSFTVERQIALPAGLIGLAIAAGMDRSILTGKDPDWFFSVGLSLASIYVNRTDLPVALVTGVLVGISFYFSQLWAVRQEPDTTARQRLARPHIATHRKRPNHLS